MKVTGVTVLLVDDGVDTGPIIAQGVGRGPRRRRRGRRCTSGSRSSSARCSSTPWAGWPATATASKDRKVRSCREQRHECRDRGAARSAARWSASTTRPGSRSSARACTTAGVEIVSTGSTAARIAAAGVPVTPVEELTGFPECLDGRVKTLHPRVHAGLLADLRNADHARAARRARHRAVRAGRGQPLPVRARRSRRGASAGRVRRADRHRRPVDGARRGQEPRDRRGRRRPGALRRGARGRRRPAASTSPQRKRLAGRGVPAHRVVRRRRRVAGSAACWRAPTAATHGFPAWVGATCERADVLRYGENPHQRAALYADRRRTGWPGRAAARQGDVVQQLRRHRRRAAGPRTTSPSRASRSSSTPTRAASRSAPTSPRRTARRTPATRLSAFGGVIAVNRPVTRRDGRAGRRDLHRGDRRARRTRTARSRCWPRKKNIRVLRCRRRAGRGRRSSGRSAAACCCRPPTGSRPSGDDPADWTLVTGEAADAERRWPTSPSPGGPAARSSPTRSCSPTDGATVGVGMGQVNRVDSAQLAVERAGDGGRRVGGRVRRVLPVPRRARGADRRPGVQAVVAARRFGPRRRWSIEAAQKAGVTMYFTGTRHFFH